MKNVDTVERLLKPVDNEHLWRLFPGDFPGRASVLHEEGMAAAQCGRLSKTYGEACVVIYLKMKLNPSSGWKESMAARVRVSLDVVLTWI